MIAQAVVAVSKTICFNCWDKLGYKRRDRGCHTGTLIECGVCGNLRVCIHERHYVRKIIGGKNED